MKNWQGERWTLHLVITPCLLGFDLKEYVTIAGFPGHSHPVPLGIFPAFGELVRLILFLDLSRYDDWTVELR